VCADYIRKTPFLAIGRHESFGESAILSNNNIRNASSNMLDCT
jgi:hypothetical protein